MKTVYLYRLITGEKQKRFHSALKEAAIKAGYKFAVLAASELPKRPIDHSDVLIIWNRHLNQDYIATQFEKAGARVLNFENAYIQVADTTEDNPYFSVGYSFHNQKKYSPECRDSGERFKSFNREIKDWQRNEDGDILILTQSKTFNQEGLGYAHFKQPAGWDWRICHSLYEHYKNKNTIRYRKHPNGRYFVSEAKQYPKFIEISNGKDVAIEHDLDAARISVVYTSNATTDSLLHGVPVYVTGPQVYMLEACSTHIDQINYSDNREELFHRMAWAQYSLDEISSGFAFDILLNL